MGNIGGLALIAALVLTGCSAPADTSKPEFQPVVQVKPPASAQGDMLAELRPLLKTLQAEDSALIREGFEACGNLLFRDKDSYRESLLKQYESDLTLGLDHLTVAAAAKKYLCPS